MNVNRRDFIKITGTSAAGAAILGLGLNLKPIKSHAQSLKINHCKETTSICCYCAVGCGVICSTGRVGAGKIINIEGDPDHPVNEGALCAKGAGLSQLANNDSRITAPMYRAPYSNRWRNRLLGMGPFEHRERVKKKSGCRF